MVRPSHNYNLRDRKKLKDLQQARNEENQRNAEVEEQSRQQRAESRRMKKRREEVEERSSSSEESDSDMDSAPTTAASRRVQNRKKKACPPQKKRARQSDPDYYPSSGRDRELGRVEEEDSSSSSSSDEDEDKPFQGFRKERNGSKQFENHQVTHTFDDLQGIQEIKKKVLGALVYPFCGQKKAEVLKLKPQKGLLLTGKPGTGKSRLADAIVNEIRDQGVNVLYYKESGTCLSKYVGESERNLRKLFATAEKNAPSVIFLDELDGLGGKRRVNDASSSHNTILTTLLVELNRIKPGKVILIAATNCPELCDSALIRKGRFDLHIKVPLPNEAERREILSFYLDNIEVNLSEAMMQKLIAETEGNTGSDLESLVGELHLEAIDKLFPNGNYRNMPNRQIKERKEELLEDTIEELINEKWDEEEEVEDEEEQADLDSEEETDEESEEDESEEEMDDQEEE